MLKKILIGMWVIFLLGVGAAFTYFVLIFNGSVGYMPDLDQLENPIDKYATQIYSSDGKLLATWYDSRDSRDKTNRISVPFDSLPSHLVNALVATEDERFYDHSGVDFRALFRAAIKRGVMRKKSAGGGSTITQQLAKQLYSAHARDARDRAMQKPVEWCIALKLERFYTKEELISMYLNYLDFLNNAIGIKTAALTYFSKGVQELDTLESATLVGMCQNPSYYNPRRYPERCRERRNVVLSQMVRSGYLESATYDSLSLEPLTLHYTTMSHDNGQGTYMREYLRQVLMAHEPHRSEYSENNYQKFYDDSLAWANDPLYGWCNKHKKRNGEHYNIYGDGLKIHTTIDSRMQEYAERAVEEWVVGELQPAFEKELKNSRNAPYNARMTAAARTRAVKNAMRQSGRYHDMRRYGSSDEEIETAFNTPTEMTVYTSTGEKDTTMTPLDSILYYKRFLRTGFMCMDAQTGYVKAYVGGINYKYFQYDHCMTGRRQVGSTMKPFLYSLAMENGWYPNDSLLNVRRTYHLDNGQTWSPRNGSTAHYNEMVPLTWGLQTSNNWVAAQLMEQLSPEALVRLLHGFGIKNQYLVPTPSLCLGPCDISVCEMVSAYTTFPNKGIRRHPLLVTHIEDADGNLLEDFRPILYEVISEEASYKMITLMRGVVDSGTGRRMRSTYGIQTQMGGKTGTSNDNADGWFVGYTPELSFGAWVGGEERDIHFLNTSYGQGAHAALPICAKFLKSVFADSRLGYHADARFDIPEGTDVNARNYELGAEFYIPTESLNSLDVETNEDLVLPVDEEF